MPREVTPTLPEQGPAVPKAAILEQVKPKRESQRDRVEHYLCELERFAAEQGLPFDRKAMPGKKTDFDAYLRKADVTFSKLAKSTLADYIKKANCAWPSNLGPNPPSSNVYSHALKWMNEPWANAKQRG